MTDGPEASAPLDQLVAELQRRRADAGSPSYAEIAGRVEAGRRERGLGDFEARVSRSTVYDLFRIGRRRIDVGLFVEVLRALGADEDEIARWRAKATSVLTPAPAVAPARVSASTVALPGLATSGARLRALPVRQAATLLIACVVINMLGNLLVSALPIDLYLDMIGTAIAAVVVGPWQAVAVGVATNLWEVHTGGTWHGLWFALSNATGALLWGYGVRHGLGRTILRFLGLNVAVAFFVTVVSTCVILTVFDNGATGHAADALVHNLVHRGHGLALSVFSTNLITSLQDKLIAGFIALIVAESIAVRQSGESTRLPLGG